LKVPARANRLYGIGFDVSADDARIQLNTKTGKKIPL